MMERLTEKQSSGYDLKAMNGEWCNKYCEKQIAQTCNECGIYQAIHKLAEYEDLEEQGLLLRLPCKVGTSVYMVAQDCDGDTLDCMRGDCEGCPYLYSFVEEYKFEAYMLEEIGKSVFLTQAEAEQKLKEMESD